MDVRTTFRSLVTKEFMPHHDYGTTFEFRTVFYKSAFSYACCPCAFEHEFLLYIDRYGNINEDVYQKNRTEHLLWTMSSCGPCR